jgi:hypothetical protein
VVAEGTAGIAPLAAMTGDPGAMDGDGRGAVEPQPVAPSAATSVTTANLQPEVGRGSRDLTH